MTRRSLFQTLATWPVAARLSLSAPAQREVLLSISLGGRPFGLFQNSYLPVFDTDLQTVTIVNERGEVAASFKPTVPGAAVLLIRDAAVSPEKTIVVSMGVKSADGRMAALLMFSDFKGTPQRIVRTNPFAAGRLIFLPDGRLRPPDLGEVTLIRV